MIEIKEGPAIDLLRQLAKSEKKKFDFVFLYADKENMKEYFDIGSPSMEDLTAGDIKFRIEEYLMMNVPPFELKELKIQ